MRDELEIVRSLGADDHVRTTQAVAVAEAALRGELERERREAARLNGTGPGTRTDTLRHRVPCAHGRNRRRRWALGLLVPAALVAGGATYALTRSSVDYTAGFGCYDAVSLQANVAVPGGDASNPVAACRALWLHGDMGRAGRRGAPPQIACVLPSGAVGVFPSGDPRTCSRLDLARLPADYEHNAARFGELASTLRGVVDPVGDRCLTASQATAVVSRELVGLGFTGWRVRIPSRFAAGDRCAMVDFGQWQRTVFVLSGPRPAPQLATTRQAFAATHAPINPSTVAFVAGDGGYVVYTASSRTTATPCVVMLGTRAPQVGCASGRGITLRVVRLPDGRVVLAGTVSPAADAAGGVQVRLRPGHVNGLTIAPNGGFGGYAPAGADGAKALLVALDRDGRPAATARIRLTPENRR